MSKVKLISETPFIPITTNLNEGYQEIWDPTQYSPVVEPPLSPNKVWRLTASGFIESTGDLAFQLYYQSFASPLDNPLTGITVIPHSHLIAAGPFYLTAMIATYLANPAPPPAWGVHAYGTITVADGSTFVFSPGRGIIDLTQSSAVSVMVSSSNASGDSITTDFIAFEELK